MSDDRVISLSAVIISLMTIIVSFIGLLSSILIESVDTIYILALFISTLILGFAAAERYKERDN